MLRKIDLGGARCCVDVASRSGGGAARDSVNATARVSVNATRAVDVDVLDTTRVGLGLCIEAGTSPGDESESDEAWFLFVSEISWQGIVGELTSSGVGGRKMDMGGPRSGEAPREGNRDMPRSGDTEVPRGGEREAPRSGDKEPPRSGDRETPRSGETARSGKKERSPPRETPRRGDVPLEGGT